jgi:hypothetical protein
MRGGCCAKAYSIFTDSRMLSSCFFNFSRATILQRAGWAKVPAKKYNWHSFPKFMAFLDEQVLEKIKKNLSKEEAGVAWFVFFGRA